MASDEELKQALFAALHERMPAGYAEDLAAELQPWLQRLIARREEERDGKG